MRLIPSILALSLCSASSFAKDDWFEIELVIFDRQGENSRETWRHDATEVNTSGAVDIEMENLMPSYPDCPLLDQEQIKALIEPNEVTTSVAADVTEPIEVTTNVAADVTEPLTGEEPIDDVVKCVVVLPLDENEENTDELPDQQPDTSSENLSSGSKSEYAVLTTQVPQPRDVEQQIEPIEEIVEPQLQLPTTFSYQSINYQVVEPSQRLTQIPVQVNATELASELLTPHLLDNDSLQLKELVKKLKWQKNLTPKLHIGWRQKVEARHLAKPLHLFAGQDYSDRYHRDGSQITEQQTSVLDTLLLFNDNAMSDADSMSQHDPEVPAQPPETPDQIWEIDGLFNVYLNRYLFIEANITKKIPENITMMVNSESQVTDDMLIASNQNDQLQSQLDGTGISLVKNLAPLEIAQIDIVPGKMAETDVPWLVKHTLSQHRRVKSKQIHYFDHPNLGIIVQIRRFELPEPTPDTQL